MFIAALKTLGHYLPWQSGHRREFVRNLLLQLYFTYIQSIMMLAVLGLAFGVAIAFQSQFGLALLGNNEQLGKILVFTVFRELAPLMTCLLLTARSVTAIASELATIKVQQEIEALSIMGINVFHYVLAPRILSGMISLFCMATTFWGFALLGGWLGANLSGHFPATQYLSSVARALRPGDFLFFVLKTMLLGLIVVRIGCNRGLSLQAAPFEVPIVTNRAVVDALTVSLSVHFMLSFAYYVIYGIDL